MASKQNALLIKKIKRSSPNRISPKPASMKNSKLYFIKNELKPCSSNAASRTEDCKDIALLYGPNNSFLQNSIEKLQITNGQNSHLLASKTKRKLKHIKNKLKKSNVNWTKIESKEFNLKENYPLNEILQADLLAKNKPTSHHKSTAFLTYLDQIYKNEKQYRDDSESSDNIRDFQQYIIKKKIPIKGFPLNKIEEKKKPSILQTIENSSKYPKKIIQQRYLKANNLFQFYLHKKNVQRNHLLNNNNNLNYKIAKKSANKSPLAIKRAKEKVDKISQLNKQLIKKFDNFNNSILNKKKSAAINKIKNKNENQKSVELKKVIEKVIPNSVITTIAKKSNDGFLKSAEATMRQKSKLTTKLPNKLKKSVVISNNLRPNAMKSIEMDKNKNSSATNIEKAVEEIKPILDFAKCSKIADKTNSTALNKVLNKTNKIHLNELLKNNEFLGHIEYYTKQYAMKLKTYLEQLQETSLNQNANNFNKLDKNYENNLNLTEINSIEDEKDKDKEKEKEGEEEEEKEKANQYKCTTCVRFAESPTIIQNSNFIEENNEELNKNIVSVLSKSNLIANLKKKITLNEPLNHINKDKSELNDKSFEISAIFKAISEALCNNSNLSSTKNAYELQMIDSKPVINSTESDHKDQKQNKQTKLVNDKHFKDTSTKSQTQSEKQKKPTKFVNVKVKKGLSSNHVLKKSIPTTTTTAITTTKTNKYNNFNRKIIYNHTTTISKNTTTKIKNNKDKDKDKDNTTNNIQLNRENLKRKQLLLKKKKGSTNLLNKKNEQPRNASTSEIVLTHSNNKTYLQNLGKTLIKEKLLKQQNLDKKLPTISKINQITSKFTNSNNNSNNNNNEKNKTIKYLENHILPTKQPSKYSINFSQKIEQTEKDNRKYLTNLRVTKALSSYLSYNEIMLYLNYIESRFQNFVKVETIGYSYEKRPIKSIIIDVRPNENTNSPTPPNAENNLNSEKTAKEEKTAKSIKPRNIIFIEAGTHAREWLPVCTAIHCIYQLTEKRMHLDSSFNNLRFYIIPLLNPDGYEYSRSQNRNWRKNRRPHSNGRYYGIDCNRNFNFQWNYGNRKPNSETYPGEKAFSEVETRALAKYLYNLSSEVLMFISLHAHGESIMYPWAYTSLLPKNANILNIVAKAGKEIVQKHSGRQYSVGPISKVTKRLISGSVVDYVYGVIKAPLAYVIELPSNRLGFQPDTCVIKPTCFESWLCISEMCKTGFNLYTKPKSSLK